MAGGYFDAVVNGVSNRYLVEPDSDDAPFYRKRLNALASFQARLINVVGFGTPTVDQTFQLRFTLYGGATTAVANGYVKTPNYDKERRVWSLTGYDLPVKLKERQMTQRLWYGSAAPSGTTPGTGVTTEAGAVKDLLNRAGVAFTATSILGGGAGNAIDKHRVDWSNPLIAIAELANIWGRDWWMQQDAGVNHFYYGTKTGTPITYTLGRQVVGIEDKTSDINLRNSILALGAYDGKAQVGNASGRSTDGGSIAAYGTRELNVPMRNLVSPTLAATAQATLLSAKKDPIRTVRLKLMRTCPEISDSLDLGSTVTLLDRDGVTTLAALKCVAIEAHAAFGYSIIELGSLSEPFLTDLNQLSTDLSVEQKAAQGAQNWTSPLANDNANSGRPLYVPFNIPGNTTTQILQVDVAVSAAALKGDQTWPGENVAGSSGTGTANVSESSTSPVVTLVANSSTTVTVPASSTATGTMIASLPSAPFGYSIKITIVPIDTTPLGVGTAIGGVIQYSKNIESWITPADVQFTYYPINASGSALEYSLTNADASDRQFNIGWIVYKFTDHNHFPGDSGHSGHLAGSYNVPAQNLAASLSGGTATTATVDIAISLDGGATFNNVQTGVSLPSTGGLISVPIGAGAGQIPIGQTGQCVIRITPTTSVYLAGQVSVQSNVIVPS